METNNSESPRERSHFSDEEKFEILQNFHQSGLTAAGFAREWGLNYGTFTKWLSKERKKEHPVEFVEVTAHSGSSDKPAEPVKIACQFGHPSGWTISFENSLSTGELTRFFVELIKAC